MGDRQGVALIVVGVIFAAVSCTVEPHATMDWPLADGAHLRFDLIQVTRLDCRATVPALAWGVSGASLLPEGVPSGWGIALDQVPGGPTVVLYQGPCQDPVTRVGYTLSVALYPPIFLDFNAPAVESPRFDMSVRRESLSCVDDYRGTLIVWGAPE